MLGILFVVNISPKALYVWYIVECYMLFTHVPSGVRIMHPTTVMPSDISAAWN